MLRWGLLIACFAALSVSAVLAQDSAPAITHGPISGEVTADSAVLWARGSATGTLTFEAAEDAEFGGEIVVASVDVDESSDFTGQVTLHDLNTNQEYFYRVSLDDGDPVQGQFKTAPAPDDKAAFDFVIGACLGGQGYCRDPQTGWKIFDTMLAQQPDFFLMTGDGIYAGGTCPVENNRNVPGAEAPAADLASFRARYRYHLEDPHYAQFLAHTPVYTGWDDHEVRDNYSAGLLQSLNPQLLADARQAYFEYWAVSPTDEGEYRLYRKVSYGANADFFILDTRSYRDPIVNWDPSPRNLTHKTMLGADQLAWLKQGLSESTATWKFIVSSVPLSYPTGFPQPEVDGRDGWANGADRSGYETELMGLLYYIEAHDIDNIMFLTGDAHWPFAISYDPDHDGTANFYELSSSPLSAIVLPPVSIDQTFNPTVLYAEGEFQGTLFNFGRVSIAEDGALNFRIIDRDGFGHYNVTLKPE